MEGDDNDIGQIGQQVMDSIRQPYRSVYEKVSHFFDPVKNAVVDNDPTNKVDPEDVRKATASFAKKPEEQKSAAKPLSQRTLGGKARPKKGTTVNRQMQRKSE